MTDDLWRRDAACIGADTSWFFPKQGDYLALRNALALCSVCPVREACLEAALEEEAQDLRVVGIRGGLSAKQRRTMRRAERQRRQELVDSGDAASMVVVVLEAVRDR